MCMEKDNHVPKYFKGDNYCVEWGFPFVVWLKFYFNKAQLVKPVCWQTVVSQISSLLNEPCYTWSCLHVDVHDEIFVRSAKEIQKYMYAPFWEILIHLYFLWQSGDMGILIRISEKSNCICSCSRSLDICICLGICICVYCICSPPGLLVSTTRVCHGRITL